MDAFQVPSSAKLRQRHCRLPGSIQRRSSGQGEGRSERAAENVLSVRGALELETVERRNLRIVGQEGDSGKIVRCAKRHGHGLRAGGSVNEFGREIKARKCRRHQILLRRDNRKLGRELGGAKQRHGAQVPRRVGKLQRGDAPGSGFAVLRHRVRNLPCPARVRAGDHVEIAVRDVLLLISGRASQDHVKAIDFGEVDSRHIVGDLECHSQRLVARGDINWGWRKYRQSNNGGAWVSGFEVTGSVVAVHPELLAVWSSGYLRCCLRYHR